MRYKHFLLVIVAMCPGVKTLCDENYGDLWKPSWVDAPREDLRCDSQCIAKLTAYGTDEYDKCCTCRSCAVWEGKEVELFVEFVSVLGRSLVISDQASNKSVVYKVEQTDSEMTEIPSNLCMWDNETKLEQRYPNEFHSMQDFMGNIVKLSFENNKIKKLPSLHCLVKLDKLNLKNNQLVFLSNTSFTNLENLRSIDFSGNHIKKFDPNILTSEHLKSLFDADFSHNELAKMDVSNMVSLYPFCQIDYGSNKITELVNEASFTFNLSKTYGPGFVSFRGNNFNTWPDFESILNLTDIAQLGHLFSFGFDFRDIPLHCDCNIERFMAKAYAVINVEWRNYMNVICTQPENLAGTPVVKVPPEDLICQNETECDPRCTCIDKPYYDTLFIDCSNSNLKELPEIPYSRYSHYVSLNVSKNQITRIGNMSYLSRISMLDISGNNLIEINKNIANLLENASYFDISNNLNLKELPQMFQYHNVCSRNMENLQISCDCKSSWIEKWVHSKPCQTYSNLFECEIPKEGIKPALDFTESMLDCFPNHPSFLLETLMAATIVCLVLIGTIIYIFRYELLIVYLRLRQKCINTVIPMIKYDVFLSFNDADVNVQRWVRQTLVQNLTVAGYRVFQAGLDVAFGAERDAEIINVLSLTRNFLVIMSDSYLNDVDDGMRSWTENEWKYGWKNFKSDRSKNIVLVNFDHVSSFDVPHPQIKAFLRVGCKVDFENHKRNIMQQIFEKIGKPFRVQKLPGKDFQNKNQKFQQPDLFVIANKAGKHPEFEMEKYFEEIDNEEKEAKIITKYYQKENQSKLIAELAKGKGKSHNLHNRELKQCKYRKCYACAHCKDEIGNSVNNQKQVSGKGENIKVKNVDNTKEIIETYSNNNDKDSINKRKGDQSVVQQKSTVKDTKYFLEGKHIEKDKNKNEKTLIGKANSFDNDKAKNQNDVIELQGADSVNGSVDSKATRSENYLRHFIDNGESFNAGNIENRESVSRTSSKASFYCEINSLTDIYV